MRIANIIAMTPLAERLQIDTLLCFPVRSGENPKQLA
jgi:hypothetical protein